MNQLRPNEPVRLESDVDLAPDLQANTPALRVQLRHIVDVDVEPFDDTDRQRIIDVDP